MLRYVERVLLGRATVRDGGTFGRVRVEGVRLGRARVEGVRLGRAKVRNGGYFGPC